MEQNKQSVSGFKVITYQVKKGKDTEHLKLVLQADVENIGAGEYGFGEVLKALWSHQASDMDVGFSVFVKKEEEE